MTDTATARFGARQQSQGSNVNTWGDDKLNEVLRLFDRGTKGVQSLVMTGDMTLSWTNYIATNNGQCAVLVLTGSLSSPANLIVPSREWTWDVIKNATGQTITVKPASGVGVAIPNGRYMAVYCDGVDCFNSSPTQIPGPMTVAGGATFAGQLSGIAAGTATTDAVNKTQMEAAIAAAALPATSGTVLNSLSDTTAGYLSQKISEGDGVVLATANPGTNEAIRISVDTSELADYRALTGEAAMTITSGTTALTDRRRARLVGGTATLPTMTQGSFVIVELAPAAGVSVTIARNSQTIDGTAANDTYTGDGGVGPVILYTYSSAGAVVSRLISGRPA